MQLSDAEWRLMNCLWTRGERSAREVHGDVAADTRWAYTTVKTMLDRLVEKGALRVKLRGNTSFYTTAIEKRSTRTEALRALLDRAFGGKLGHLVEHMVDDAALTTKERAELEALVSKLEKRAKS